MQGDRDPVAEPVRFSAGQITHTFANPNPDTNADTNSVAEPEPV